MKNFCQKYPVYPYNVLQHFVLDLLQKTIAMQNVKVRWRVDRTTALISFKFKCLVIAISGVLVLFQSN